MSAIPEISMNKFFLNQLASALRKTLPGNKAHLKMASSRRIKELDALQNKSSAVESSILILFYPKRGKTFTALMLRPTYDGVHSGQVSFPGGRRESGDSSLLETALREAHEEMNIIPSDVNVIGTLSELYIPPSNYIVLPVVAYSEKPPEFIAEKSEVEAIIETDLDFLFDPEFRKETTINLKGGYKIQTPYYDVKNHIVWGATAMILSELKDVIESIG